MSCSFQKNHFFSGKSTVFPTLFFKIAAVLFVLFSFVCKGETLEFSHPVPVFEKADVFSKQLRLLPPGKYETGSHAVRAFSNRHPIAYYADFAELKEGGFVSPEVSVDDGNAPFFLPADFQWQTPVTAVLIATLAVVIFCLVRGKKNDSLEKDSFKETLFLILIPVLLRQIFLLSETAFWSNAIPSAADEPGYFKVAFDLLHGSVKGPWNFTVGLGIIYLPFILLTGAREYYDIAVAFSYFSGLIIAPGALALFFLVLKNFKVKSFCAFTAVLIWALYPFFIYHAELWNSLTFRPLFALPCFLEGIPDWWRFYSVCINAGFNAMSDTPGLLALLGTIWLAQKLPLSVRNVFFIGAAYGFCCLIRINYIFLAPLIGFILLAKGDLKAWRFLLKLSVAGAGGFLLTFIWQLLVNFHHFGNPLVFGYSLHYLDFPPEKRPDTGFNWSTLLELRNIRFLAGANKFLFTAGIAGLLFVRARYTRIALTLGAVPLILFFFGYTHTYCDARRFIMMAFPMFIGAFCAVIFEIGNNFNEKKQKYILLLFLLFAALLWFMPPEIYAICLCLLLLRTLFDLQQELTRGILIK